nr:hypothetical protein [uncultured Oscillibacter sp.]
MALFSRKKKQQPPVPQPRKDWLWTLTLNGRPTAQFDWADIVHGLDALDQDQDSFLILEQKDPSAPKRYWFLQSARALAGPHAGKYIVGCGCSTSQGPRLLEQYYDTSRDIIPLFAAAYRGEPLDLSGFEDHSDFLPANS